MECILEGAVLADKAFMSRTQALSTIRYGLQMLTKGRGGTQSASECAGVYYSKHSHC